MKIIRKILLVLWVGTFAQLVQAAEFAPAEGSAEGEIQALDFGQSTLRIQGYEFAMDASAQVEIGGTYGAFTLLREGMMVEYRYRRYDDGRRVIFELRELTGGREAVLL